MRALTTIMDTMIAPKDAFQRISRCPTWGVALLAAATLFLAGHFLQQPAESHALLETLKVSPWFVQQGAARQQEILTRTLHTTPIAVAISTILLIASVLVIVLMNTALLLAANAMFGGTAQFKHLWAGSMNIAVPTIGVSSAALGITCVIIGAAKFDSPAEIVGALPTAALLAPAARGILSGILQSINLFTVWGMGLNALFLRFGAGVQFPIAWASAAFILLCTVGWHALMYLRFF